MSIRQVLWKISTLRIYFLRGHSNWFAYVFGLLNFITISFYLLIENLTAFPDSFRFRHYVFFFVIIYTPIAILVGYFDMKKGTYRVEQKMAKELSPLWKDVFDHLYNLQTTQDAILKELQSKS